LKQKCPAGPRFGAYGGHVGVVPAGSHSPFTTLEPVGHFDGVPGAGGSCAPVVIFDELKCGFSVLGIPHIFDSVLLTGVSFAAGLLGLHIASFCAGVNVLAFT